MSDKERYGTRDMTYSAWHRIESVSRFFDKPYDAWRLGMIDIDDCEYCRHCFDPLALIELAQDIGQSQKPMAVTCKLARRADIPAFRVFYTVSGSDIERFRVTQLEPCEEPETILSPKEYAWFLLSLHNQHKCTRKGLGIGAEKKEL